MSPPSYPHLVKLAVILGWVLLALEALFVLGLFASKNMGDDAAGRGLGTAFGFVLAPILLLAAGLFVWGQRGGPRAVFWIGFGIMAIPLAIYLKGRASNTLNGIGRSANARMYGKFDDARLTKLARAIERFDTAGVRAIIAEGPIDFNARSRRGRTILGRAVEWAFDYRSPPEALESVRLLLAAGAKPVANVVYPEYYQGDPDSHLLVAYVFGGNSANTIPLLDILLAAGADPNMRNHEGQPLYYSTYMNRAKLEVLAKHGADFTAPDTSRDDRVGWTAAMFAAEMGDWDSVNFLLDHGSSADTVAPDGTSVRKSFAEKTSRDDTTEAVVTLRKRLATTASAKR